MSIDQGLAIAGIILTVIFGVWAVPKITKSIREKRVSQKQSVGAGGSAIQSGRDTKIEK